MIFPVQSSRRQQVAGRSDRGLSVQGFDWALIQLIIFYVMTQGKKQPNIIKEWVRKSLYLL